jgi:hypothetical protein
MVSEIRIYCEGGGDSNATKDLLRKGLNGFLRDLVKIARNKRIGWHLIPCGSRFSAYEDFGIALKTHPKAFSVLLVDSEGPVKKKNPWAHLLSLHKWKSLGMDDSHCHLMVQAMEAWLIADRGALEKYYGQGFNITAIPKDRKVEQIEKSRLLPALNEATRNTKKGEYHKTKHAPDILERLDAVKVRQAAPHCDRLFKTLAKKMGTTI